MTLAERVQRIVAGDLPVLHVETEIPQAPWRVRIDGAVTTPADLNFDAVRSLPAASRVIDVHCVWGWSRTGIEWCGTSLRSIAALVSPQPDADNVVMGAHDSPYASCFTLDEATEGLVAWEQDGRPITPEHGGPLRFVPPPGKWAYKGVKWLGRITFTTHLEPGFWEEAVGDVRGDIPPEVLDDVRRRTRQ